MTGPIGRTVRSRGTWLGRATVASVILLNACAPGYNNATSNFEPAGFWTGVWHGIGAVGFLLYSLGGHSGIYEIQNTGFGYNAGFVLGLITFVGLAGVLLLALLEIGDSEAFAVVPLLASATILLVGAIQLVVLVVAFLMAQYGK